MLTKREIRIVCGSNQNIYMPYFVEQKETYTHV